MDSFKLLRGSIRTALDRENPKDFSTTYERIYAACAIVVRDSSNHTVVREKSNYADSLLKDLQDQIGKCVVRLKGPYLAGSYEGLESIQEFNNICSWYEGRIVSGHSAFMAHSSLTECSAITRSPIYPSRRAIHPHQTIRAPHQVSSLYHSPVSHHSHTRTVDNSPTPNSPNSSTNPASPPSSTPPSPPPSRKSAKTR